MRLFLSICLILVGTFPAAVASAEDVLTSRLPVEVAGGAEIRAEAGAVRLSPGDALGTVELVAERVTIEHAWERGVRATAGVTRTSYVTDRGSESVPIADAAVRFGSSFGAPLFLAFANDGSPDFLVGAPRGFTATPVEDPVLVGVGMRQAAVAAGEPSELGFWYIADGPTIMGRAEGYLRVEGSFSIFVHNITIDAGGSGSSWSNWTGYRESSAAQPVGEFDFRVTVLHVENGLLIVPSSPGLVFGVPHFEADVEGTIAFSSVSGRLLQHGTTRVLENEALSLRGAGVLSMEALAGDRPTLAAVPGDGFGVLGEEDGRRSSTPVAAPVGWFELLSLSGFLLVGLGVVALNEVGVIPGPTPALQRRRHARWMRRGNAAAIRGNWALSAWCYEKATRANRDDPLAWYDWAYGELAAGRYARAEEVAVQASAIPGIDRLDVLELRASAAWEMGHQPAFAAHFAALAEGSLVMARGLLDDLGIDLADLEGPLRQTLEPSKPEDLLDGYA